jgi:hypothetical protein
VDRRQAWTIADKSNASPTFGAAQVTDRVSSLPVRLVSNFEKAAFWQRTRTGAHAGTNDGIFATPSQKMTDKVPA